MKQRLFIDVTDLRVLRMNTGIGRVQKNIIVHSLPLSRSLDVECNAVAYIGIRRFRKVEVKEHDVKYSLGYFDIVWQALEQPWHFRRLTEKVLPLSGFKRIMEHYWHGHARWLLFLPLLALILPLIILSIIYSHLLPRHKVWIPSKGDVFLVGGSSWLSYNFHSALQYVKSKGAKVVVLIYDVIPITHPSFYSVDFSKMFSSKFRSICSSADMLIADSYHVQTEIEEYLARSNIGSRPTVDHFKLGVDLDCAKPQGVVRPAVRQLFTDGAAPYLSVGTIEPRKNYPFLLGAFDQIWQILPDVPLCIVGGYGWQMEDFVVHLQNHPRYGKSLFWFTDISDTELEFCYRRARALVYPSIVEGFGLPLVEALHHGCPVLASEIPVFQEIGGDYCTYFSLASAQNLARLILDVELRCQSGILKKPESYKTLSWEESTANLLTMIRDHFSD
jgi:glycosyltransferase involved in cell wall biosynthesis